MASEALTQLPFEVLVTAKPSEASPRFEAYRDAAWLGQRHAITMLPSVASLKSAERAKQSAASMPFIGFGNPLLTGATGQDRSAFDKQRCGTTFDSIKRLSWGVIKALPFLFRSGQADVEALRRQPPLPETADELCEVARTLGTSNAKLGQAVYLGQNATVSQVKALSMEGVLGDARVVHFATHGLIAGETALFDQNHAEPALLLTPPERPAPDDNGLLVASTIAQLKLNADWVILSACNTAAGDESAEALSGLARAFFYAGARAILVSHWYVDSQATVSIVTGTVANMRAAPNIGRAEALRRSIAAMIAKGGSYAHPSIWGPFVLVGKGE